MELQAFVQQYKGFLHECKEKGWYTEILIEEFGNYLALLRNNNEIEVQFFIEVDVESLVKLNEKKRQSLLNYGVIRTKGEGDQFANEILHAFHSYMNRQYPSRKYIYYDPNNNTSH